MSKTVEEIISEHKRRVGFETCEPNEYEVLIKDINQLLIEAKIEGSHIALATLSTAELDSVLKRAKKIADFVPALEELSKIDKRSRNKVFEHVDEDAIKELQQSLKETK